jgi:hypothetical protein
MRIIAFIKQPAVIAKILRHLARCPALSWSKGPATAHSPPCGVPVAVVPATGRHCRVIRVRDRALAQGEIAGAAGGVRPGTGPRHRTARLGFPLDTLRRGAGYARVIAAPPAGRVPATLDNTGRPVLAILAPVPKSKFLSPPTYGWRCSSRRASHRAKDALLSADFLPRSKPSTPMSSSRSG